VPAGARDGQGKNCAPDSAGQHSCSWQDLAMLIMTTAPTGLVDTVRPPLHPKQKPTASERTVVAASSCSSQHPGRPRSRSLGVAKTENLGAALLGQDCMLPLGIIGVVTRYIHARTERTRSGAGINFGGSRCLRPGNHKTLRWSRVQPPMHSCIEDRLTEFVG
jgi:hypothetical protein